MLQQESTAKRKSVLLFHATPFPSLGVTQFPCGNGKHALIFLDREDYDSYVNFFLSLTLVKYKEGELSLSLSIFFLVFSTKLFLTSLNKILDLYKSRILTWYQSNLKTID